MGYTQMHKLKLLLLRAPLQSPLPLLPQLQLQMRKSLLLLLLLLLTLLLIFLLSLSLSPRYANWIPVEQLNGRHSLQAGRLPFATRTTLK